MTAYAAVLGPLDEDEKLLFFLATHIAPVLKGLRPATLVCFGAGTSYDRAWLRREKKLVRELPLSCYPMPDDKGHKRFLFYDKNALSVCLGDPAVRRFLSTRGYEITGDTKSLLDQLAHRFLVECPHEVGVFLGYPLADVFCFIQGMRPCLMTSYWKVYTNREKAQKSFAALDRERDLIVEALQQGHSMGIIWKTLVA